MAYRISHIAYRVSHHVSRITDHAPSLAVIAALVFSAMYFLVAIPRIFYPYDLDFLEDSMLMQSLRVADGQPVFVPPNVDFVPHVYMPLYTWLGGLLFKVAGPSFVPLRLLSLGATLATTLLIYWIARRESGLRWIGFVCAGLFLGGYRINGFWYEVVRVDSLFVALILGGLTLGVYAGRSNLRLILSAGVLALAFFTKQTGVLIGAGLAAYLFVTIGRRAWLFAITFGVLAIVPLIILNAVTDGWFFYHVFRIGSADPIEVQRVINYVRFELFGMMAGLSALAIGAALIGARRSGSKVIRLQPWLIAIAMAILISGIGRARVGGSANNRMPAYALLCVAPAILMREWNAGRATEEEGPKTNDRYDHAKQSFVNPLAPNAYRWRSELIAVVIVFQFALGVYNPPRYIPSPEMRQSGDRLIRRIASIDGEVLVMMHPYYALLAGKEPSAQIATLWYVRERGALPLPEDFVARIRGQYYAAIISDESEYFEKDPALIALIETYYARDEELAESDAPPTLTGVIVRPSVVYVPRQRLSPWR